jgi:hypothetical protein
MQHHASELTYGFELSLERSITFTEPIVSLALKPYSNHIYSSVFGLQRTASWTFIYLLIEISIAWLPLEAHLVASLLLCLKLKQNKICETENKNGILLNPTRFFSRIF